MKKDKEEIKMMMRKKGKHVIRFYWNHQSQANERRAKLEEEQRRKFQERLRKEEEEKIAKRRQTEEQDKAMVTTLYIHT